MNYSIPEQSNNISNSILTNFTYYFQDKTDWGPRRDPLLIVIPISVIYVSIFITGVLGNVSTCIVIARNKCMHTATNYYLFSLAISDLLLLTSGLPPEIYSIWSRYPYVFGEEFCVMQGFAAEASANATVLTITAFTVERYVAICYPFLSHTLSKLHRAIKYIIYIWLVAIFLAIPQALAFGVVCEVIEGHVVDEHCVCIPKRKVIPHAFEISTVLFFIAPMSLITVLYILIGVQLHKSLRPQRDDSLRMKHRVYRPVANRGMNNVVHQWEWMIKERNELQEEGRKNYAKNTYATRHVVKMLVAVVIAFFICWAPFHAQRLFAIYATPTSRPMITAFQVLTYISGVFYYLSTTVNPLLYHIMSHKFRDAFRVTYKQCCKKRQTLPGGKCYSSLSARSSQVNSHSTDSYPPAQSTLKYLEEEMAHIRDSRRPLIVSFRRKKYPSPSYNPEVHEAFRNHVATSHSRFNTNNMDYNDQLCEALDCREDIKYSNKNNLNKNKGYSNMQFNSKEYDAEIECGLNLVRGGYGAITTTRFKPHRDFNSFHGSYENGIFKTDRKGLLAGSRNDPEPIEYLKLEKDGSYVDVNNLQPMHICPLNRNVDFL